MNKKGNVSWVKPSEPSFLRKFKNDIGYKEGPTVDTKRQELPQCGEDSGDSDREDEMPQVVVLKKGDLTAEEAVQVKQEIKGSDKDEQPPADGKILFKKPAKRSSDKFEGISASSNSKKKKKKSENEEKKKESGVKVKNRSLLSFGDDEEED
ncbi:hypothetical protein QTP70_011534 [Hemibagrus guttatus]|uniref:DUF4604 domain-containing protein n=1 Tax=Hemibagrus guttatus TaxID=175788 RepID=A0AAE0V9M4_9TELE|nr:hypothetical protein QTP70_011534 [Hemibagrus guttatus]KAK3571469.1 hypothetical protein QTP86_012095 [Hemibagrus guttatus]